MKSSPAHPHDAGALQPARARASPPSPSSPLTRQRNPGSTSAPLPSCKDLPAIFARKRSRSQAFEGDDELAEEEQLGPNATEDQIEWKRQQNTLAARKSQNMVYVTKNVK